MIELHKNEVGAHLPVHFCGHFSSAILSQSANDVCVSLVGISPPTYGLQRLQFTSKSSLYILLPRLVLILVPLGCFLRQLGNLGAAVQFISKLTLKHLKRNGAASLIDKLCRFLRITVKKYLYPPQIFETLIDFKSRTLTPTDCYVENPPKYLSILLAKYPRNYISQQN